MAGGRQIEFDREKALHGAMLVFWKKGFLGASLTELTTSMGINKPSMYATFGNKEKLFIQATEHYLARYASRHAKHLYAEDKSLGERLTNYLLSIVAGQCDDELPRGCYISLCVSESASESMPTDAADVINEARDFNERFLTEFFAEEVSASRLSKNIKANEVALFFVALLHGTAAMARGGKTFDELQPVVTNAVSALVKSEVSKD